MISLEEKIDTLKYIRNNLKRIKDFSVYCETLNMTYEEIINYKFERKTRHNKHEWLRYKKEVKRLTFENVKDIKTDKLFVSNKDHLKSPLHYVYDHKISVYSGFKNNIPCDIIASLCNLRVISALDNCTKEVSNYIDDENKHIFERYFKSVAV